MNRTPNQTSSNAPVDRISAAKRMLESGNWRKAERICLQALDRGGSPDVVSLLGKIHMEAGRPLQALPWLQRTVDLEPASAMARFALARALQSIGRTREAAGAWLAGIEIEPNHLFAHIGLTDALLELGLYEAGVTAARQALLIAPESADAYDRLGAAYEGLGDNVRAIEQYSRSIVIQEDNHRTRRRLASLLRAQGQLECARDILTELVREYPRDSGVRFELAGVLADAGEREHAADELQRAIALQPRFPEALNNLALLLGARGDYEEADRYFRRALAQRPDYAIAWNNLGNLCVETSRLDQAEMNYSKALVIDANYAEAHTNRALVWLLRGRFSEGWEEYEWRWKRARTSSRALPQPAWDGSPIPGKTLLLHSEQGAGDTIQFIRYARLLKRNGVSVVLHCQEAFQSLLSGMPELTAVISGQILAPHFDTHAPLMSLPRLFGTLESTIPAEVPYLSPVPGYAIPEELGEEGGLRVGLVWAGNPGHRNDRNRSISPELFRDLVQMEGVRFFSLQVGGSFPALPEFERNVTDLAPRLVDYAATAACLERLDLLITVDTSVAHLGGALGRPVWLLLPTCNDWRWLQNRRDTPWYPTMRLFRQKELGDWKSPLRQVSAELAELRLIRRGVLPLSRGGISGDN